MRFNPPPNWPPALDGWTPPPGWEPDPAWGPAPDGWKVWVKPKHTARNVIVSVVAGVVTIAVAGSALGGKTPQPVAALSSPSATAPAPTPPAASPTTAAPTTSAPKPPVTTKAPKPKPTTAPPEPTTWYPKGYSDFGNGVAWKWVPNSELHCLYGLSCGAIYVIPRDGCDAIYAEVNIEDKSGTVVGYSNDIANSITAGKRAKMQFDVTYDGRWKMFLTTLQCDGV